MQLFPENSKIDFLKLSKSAMIISGIVILLSILSISFRGLNLGIDFTGGTLIEVGYQTTADLTVVRAELEKSEFSDAVVQHFGTSKDVLVRIAPREGVSSAQISTQMLQVLQKTSSTPVEMRRVEFVGPQVGGELVENGFLALLTALGLILVYVWIRYERLLAVGSVAALIHDVIITVGVFSIFGLEFDLTVLAAVLAVIGYSLNDTIVVFDRIRENFRIIRKGTPEEIVNASLNQTLSRTVMTSSTTLLVVIALFIFGGELIHGFATALILGIVIGTYSSIYIASSLALKMGLDKEHLMPPEKEGADQSTPIV